MTPLDNIDNFLNKELFKPKREFFVNNNGTLNNSPLKHSYSALNLTNNYTVNSDSDILFDYINNKQINIKRNGEFLSLTNKNGDKVMVNIFDLFDEYHQKKPKKSKSFFNKIFNK